MNKNEVLEKEKEMWLWLYHVYVHSGQMKAITQSCYFSNYNTRIYNDLKAILIRNIRATCSGKGFNERIENWDWHSVSWNFLQGGFYFLTFRNLELWLIWIVVTLTALALEHSACDLNSTPFESLGEGNYCVIYTLSLGGWFIGFKGAKMF